MLRPCLFVFLLASSIQAQAPTDERVDWDRGEARKVIKNAYFVDMGSFGDNFRGVLGGALGVGSILRTHGIWLTDDVCWALAVFAQREERRSDEEKEAIYKDCRSYASEYYTIYVSGQAHLLSGGSHLIFSRCTRRGRCRADLPPAAQK